jgi:hypothetical protein
MGVRCRALADTARTPFGRDYTPRIKPFAAPASRHVAGGGAIAIIDDRVRVGLAVEGALPVFVLN